MIELSMALNLTPLQKNCLSMMGIDVWQQRDNDINNAQTIDKSVESVITEQEASYTINNSEAVNARVVMPERLAQDLTLMMDYVFNQSDNQLSWKVDESATELALIDNTLIIPNPAQLQESSALKKQVWTLISNSQLNIKNNQSNTNNSPS